MTEINPDDYTITIMLLLKNNWSLTGDFSASNMVFNTRFYDENIISPQIAVRTLGSDASPPIDMGAEEATYPDNKYLNFDILVRPKQDSNSSLGWAKNALYTIRKESERILRSGSLIVWAGDADFEGADFDSEDFLAVGSGSIFVQLLGWNRRDDLRKRPPLLHIIGRIQIVRYIEPN